MLGVRVINPVQLHAPLAASGTRLRFHSQARVPRFIFIKMITLKQGAEDGVQHQARCRLGQLMQGTSSAELGVGRCQLPERAPCPPPHIGEQAPRRALGLPKVSKLFSRPP